MEENTFKVRTLLGSLVLSAPTFIRHGPLAFLSLTLGSSQQCPLPYRSGVLAWLGSGTPLPAGCFSPSQLPATLVVCGPQEMAKSSGCRNSLKSDSHSDIRNLWSMATLSQPKLNVQRSNVSEDSDLDGSSLGSKIGEWYNQRAGYSSDGGWKEWDNRVADVDLKPEEMDDDTLLELELHPVGSLESHLEEEDDDARTELGQCGLIGLGALTGPQFLLV